MKTLRPGKKNKAGKLPILQGKKKKKICCDRQYHKHPTLHSLDCDCASIQMNPCPRVEVQNINKM